MSGVYVAEIAILETPRMLKANHTILGADKDDADIISFVSGCVFSLAGGAQNA